MKSIVIAVSAVVLTLAVVFAVRMTTTEMQPKAETAAVTDSTTRPKQLWTCGMHPQVIQDHPGNCPICRMKLVPLKMDSDTPSGTQAGAKRKILYYWDPMLGPSSIAQAPGKSAMGMDLVPVFEDEQSAGPTVRIDPTIVQNMGIRTAEVSRGQLDKTVRTVGMLEVPETAQYEINLRVNGWITKLYANQEGMHVHKGEALFDLYSPDLQVAEEELIGAVKSLKAMDPTASGGGRAEAEHMVDSARQKLRLWGVAEVDIEAAAKADKAPDTVPFRNPTDGHVMDKMVVEGSAVQAGMKIMRIEDHSKLWLDAQVYEDDMAQIALGQTVQVTVDAQPGKTYTGPITFIYPHLDQTSRTVLARVELDNPIHELSPGMYATANIITKPLPDAVWVPREAVIDTGTRQIAFVVVSQGHFEPRKVRMGLVGDDDRVQILEGLVPGETVVTSGQFLLDVESRTTEAIDKLRQSDTKGQVQGAATGMEPTVPNASPISVTSLVVVHCSMKNADWLQPGNSIANPYLGTAMPTCGTIGNTIVQPNEGSGLDGVVKEYLLISKALDADRMDAKAIREFKVAVDKLPGDPYSALQGASDKLQNAVDLEGARSAFQSVSAELIHALTPSSDAELVHPINPAAK